MGLRKGRGGGGAEPRTDWRPTVPRGRRDVQRSRRCAEGLGKSVPTCLPMDIDYTDSLELYSYRSLVVGVHLC